jgi:flagellar basal body-associated protein FliL
MEKKLKAATQNFLRNRAKSRENGDIVQSIIIIAIFAIVSLVAINYMAAALGTKTKGASKPTTAPSPAATTPVTPAAPIDIPISSVLAVLAIVVVALAVIMGSIWFFRKMAIAKSVTTTNIDTWKALISKHREVRANWASYELDAAKLLDFPLMTDMREPATVALHKALKHALSLEPKDIQAVKFIDAATSPFALAVNDLDVAFHTAETEARRVVWAKFSDGERKRLATAKNLLRIAMDSAASSAERQTAYKRVFKEIEGLIRIPEQALLALEKTHMLSLAA